MKLRLDEYYSIINKEWDDIESYMPEDMAEKFEKFEEKFQNFLAELEINLHCKLLFSYLIIK